MNKQTSGCPEKQTGGAGKAPGRDQPESVREPPESQEKPGRGKQKSWEAQWQQFLKTLQIPYPTWGKPQMSETTPWEDARTFLASFEQVAAACQWPEGEWVARLLPALNGEARQAFSLLAARDKEDYWKVKTAVLRREALRRDKQREHFRQFCFQELGDPRRMYSQVQELCCQWLKPEKYTKEQILELLVLEQFLASLPVDAQSWVRAGGPDSCVQAVALLEAFLMSWRETEAGMWQEPLQVWALGPLDAKDLVQGETSREHSEIFRDTQQNIKGEVSLPGLEIARSTLVLPPEDPDMDEDELSKAVAIEVEQVINPRQIGVPFHMVEQTPVQSSQQTTFWKVLQEDENVEALEGSFSPQLGLAPDSVIKEETFLPDPVESQRFPDQGSVGSFSPQLGLAPHPVKKEKTFLPNPVENQRLPGQDSDDGKGTRVKEKNSLPGGKKAVGTPRRQQGRTQEDVLVTAEVQEERYDGKGTHLKGKKYQLGGKKPVETPRRGQGKIQENMPVTAEMQEEGCESNRGQGTEPCTGCKESDELTVGPGGACSDHSPVDTEGVKSLFFKCGRRNLPESGHLQYAREECKEGHPLREKIQPKPKLDQHQGSPMEDCPELGEKTFFPDSVESQRLPGQDSGKELQEPRKSFSQRSNVLRHQIIHAGKKSYQCPECGKILSGRSSLLRHQTVHTGKKPHKCLYCGKSFSRISYLLSHQNIHTGEKPHKCHNCGKSFSQRAHLLSHQMIHTGEKPYKCHSCGRSFSWRARLLTHQKTHTKRNITAVLGVEIA